MTHHVLVAVTGEDRVGVISGITGCLYDFGADLGDASFLVLGAGFEFTGVVEVPDDVSAATLASELSSLPVLEGADVKVSEFGLQPIRGSSGKVSHRVRFSGGDRPGLVARISEVFVEYGANIVRMHSEKVPRRPQDLYVTVFDVSIPAGVAERCLAAADNTARQLQVDCSSKTV